MHIIHNIQHTTTNQPQNDVSVWPGREHSPGTRVSNGVDLQKLEWRIQMDETD